MQVLEAVAPDPSLVLVHRPFGLVDAPPSQTPLSPEKRTRSDDHLAALHSPDAALVAFDGAACYSACVVVPRWGL